MALYKNIKNLPYLSCNCTITEVFLIAIVALHKALRNATLHN